MNRISWLLILIFLISSCDTPTPQLTREVTPNMTLTGAAETVFAIHTRDALPTATNLPPVPISPYLVCVDVDNLPVYASPDPESNQVGSLKKGICLNYRTVESGWYQISDGWIAKTDTRLVTRTPLPPTPMVTATKRPLPTSTRFPTATSSAPCVCTRKYSCSDFATQRQAQRCFDYCGRNNWSGLDRDGDNVACESLP